MELRGYTVDPAAQFDTEVITFQWFDHVLHGGPLPPLLAGRVNYELMGANRWEHADSLDAAAGGYRDFQLSSERDGDHHVSDESVADAGEPLRIEWHPDSVLRIPLRAARP
ncbi:hypothetical protein [Stenotrophomonas sp. AB1(2024)]|uniref:hypothetical protein n=1 Tax=Stenotrophomonas sp. AB1(2024) TaxID=3132215 RepID=UPI003095AD02